MALGRYQFTVTDSRGNVIPGANVEVRDEADLSLVSLFSDRDGSTPLGNPFTADGEGFAAFHVAGGAYKIRVYSGTFERIWRYVPVGTAAEHDSGASLSEIDNRSDLQNADIPASVDRIFIHRFDPNIRGPLNPESPAPYIASHWMRRQT